MILARENDSGHTTEASDGPGPRALGPWRPKADLRIFGIFSFVTPFPGFGTYLEMFLEPVPSRIRSQDHELIGFHPPNSIFGHFSKHDRTNPRAPQGEIGEIIIKFWIFGIFGIFCIFEVFTSFPGPETYLEMFEEPVPSRIRS